MNTGQPSTLSQPYGFRSDLRRRIRRETDDLFRRRLAIACWIGAALFPPYALQDLRLLEMHPVEIAPATVVAIRLTACALLVAMALGIRFLRPAGAVLGVLDLIVFGGITWLVSFFTAKFWGHVPDFYVGVIQVMMVRAIFLPGGWRRALPTLVVSVISFPLGLFLWAGGTPAEVIAVDPSLFSTANVSLLVFLMLGVVGSIMYDRLQARQMRAEHEGKYRIEGVLGRGGGGMVYRAWHNRLDMPCAIKIVPAGDGATADEARRRFEREAQLTSQLKSQHVVRIFDYGETEEGDPYYAMELLDGLSWQELVERAGPQEPARAIHLMLQACEGLSEAHERGLVHRDIKPANLFVMPTREEPDFVKVLDFGVAKAVTDTAGAHLTQDGAILGTPTYMAPEQIDGHPAGARSDIYCLGGALYFLVTGHTPFGSGSVATVMHRKMTEGAPSARDRRPDLSEDLDRVVTRCLARDPVERYGSVAEFRDVLAACEIGGSWTPEMARIWWDDLDDVQAPAAAPDPSDATVPLVPAADSGADTVRGDPA